MERDLGSKCENVAGYKHQFVGDSGWYKTDYQNLQKFFVTLLSSDYILCWRYY